jgi:hypothetical protein
MAKSLLTVKTKKRKISLPRGLDRKHMGDEVSWDDIEFLSEREIRLRELEAYNWYNYFYEPKQGRKFIEEFMQETNMSRAAISMFDRLPDSNIKSSFSAMARMYTMGLQSEERRVKIEDTILDMCRKSAALARESAALASVSAPKGDPAKALIAEVESLVDDNSDNLTSFYEWLKKRSAKPAEVRGLVDYYTPWLEELVEANERIVDPDLKEAYSHMTKKDLKARMQLFRGIIADCESYLSNSRKTVVRKPRKTNPKSADKIVSKIKFMKEHTDLKIVSVDPSKIVGASELWAFNTKTNILARYIATSSTGLSVKGTTIQSFSPMSQQKKLRKPVDTLPNITGSTAKAAEKTFASEKTKSNNPNGRINEFTVILRAIK